MIVRLSLACPQPCKYFVGFQQHPLIRLLDSVPDLAKQLVVPQSTDVVAQFNPIGQSNAGVSRKLGSLFFKLFDSHHVKH